MQIIEWNITNVLKEAEGNSFEVSMGGEFNNELKKSASV